MNKYSSIPAYSFDRSIKPKHDSFVPGPGAYEIDPDQSMNRSKTNKFIIRTRSTNRKRVVDLNNNADQQQILQRKVKGFYFSRSYRPTKDGKQAFPGPGQYDHHLSLIHLMNKQGGAVIPKARKVGYSNSLRVDVPGPGHYNTEGLMMSTNKTASGFHFPSAEKPEDHLINKTPGPGAYQIIDENSKTGVVFPKDSRSRFYKKDEIPGPGKYNTNEAHKENSYSYSIHKATIMKHASSDLPGPGAYDVKDKNPKKGIIITRNFRKNHNSEIIPGPGHYSPAITTWKDKLPKFGKEVVKTLKFVNPVGPGQYNIKPSFPNVSSLNYSDQSRPKVRL